MSRRRGVAWARRLAALLFMAAAAAWARRGALSAAWGGGAGSPAGRPPAAGAPAPAADASACGPGRMTVHFYDVGQGLAALVELPDGRRLLVDTGDSPRRPGCDECAAENARLLRALRTDVGAGGRLDAVWITHQHSDHIGGAPEVLGQFAVGEYVDNGRGASKPEVRLARDAARARGAELHVVDPEHPLAPIGSSGGVRIRAVVPNAWPARCASDENDCSIGLRVDWCRSSVLFLGDAEHDEEAMLDPGGPVTLLQVAHHGSDTSTTPGFLARARPSYAVLSAGKPGQGINREYCHPRAIVVHRLVRVLGGEPSAPLEAFDGVRCDRATTSDWVSVPGSDRLWATERDGDVVLTTTGDGVFVRR